MKKILISGGEGNFAKEILKYNKKFKIFTPSKKRNEYRKFKFYY